MTTRDRRGGPRVPDGVPRPASIPFGRGPNRSDLSALPGTPGTPLPEGVGGGPPVHGQVGPRRRALSKVPLEAFSTGKPGLLKGPSKRPQEPATAGLAMGAGPGPEAVTPTPIDISNRLAAQEMRYMYPVLMRLATMPGATNQTKIMAQKMRASLPVKPEYMPRAGGNGGMA